MSVDVDIDERALKLVLGGYGRIRNEFEGMKLRGDIPRGEILAEIASAPQRYAVSPLLTPDEFIKFQDYTKSYLAHEYMSLLWHILFDTLDEKRLTPAVVIDTESGLPYVRLTLVN